jgi:hypothetical protein
MFLDLFLESGGAPAKRVTEAADLHGALSDGLVGLRGFAGQAGAAPVFLRRGSTWGINGGRIAVHDLRDDDIVPPRGRDGRAGAK